VEARPHTDATEAEGRRVTKRPLISIGDAIRAMVDLSPADGEARAAIRDLLGLGQEPDAPVQPGLGVWGRSESGAAAGAQRVMTQPYVSPPVRVSLGAPAAAGGVSTLRHVGTSPAGTDRPAWIEAAGDVMGGAALERAPPPPSPLFGPPAGRAILTAALATSVAEGDVDIQAIIDTLSRARPVIELPRLHAPTLRRGVQLLIDHGPGMVPFCADQAGFIDAIDDVLSDDRLEVLHFAGCPSRGVGPGVRSRWTEWSPPPPGTPVLAVTDVGLGGSPLDSDCASPEEWLRFAHHARDEGVALFGLVPYGASRWPPELARAMTLLHWSERTTVGEVRRAVRRAYERQR
jgi:hypothetical protein